MPLLENGQITPDRWHVAMDGEPLPEGAVIVPLERLEEGLARTGDAPLGVAIAPDVDVAVLRTALPRLELVAVTFPIFRDGRAFTQARALREHLGFKGEIRATGKPLPDQYEFLLRCGVTTVQTERAEDISVWRQAHEIITIAYQPSTLHERPQGLGLRRFLG
ncbi:hypothetical protein SXCC_04619 [Gluconacetobacter sp. SXCC-1]|uniref:DUF934 domain-containing protein n=1 Tax=Komagataeibacter rhaeticus TaxID=215221 RepID=A0A181CB73_9PROT|nr:DUF934 domain-containing protein [Komagataeibacter rhaeticus]ATU72539.1 DUF934 domain-containing protein [Komagataeibacter xylinus]EGG74515.1 hypothetical protein SXCC_04619 [Gluconacetobacter sp. SXCC-1]QIP35547.1 DUF934 domain-containing protein [Komagataeibacter rhaeticus]QOC45301.1 DUF934 domain-containing protein [Komagataeibacter rhaeticus]WPP22291.1 DUF934 domain-containing protein [Komagataeibacter rhaeticus]